MVRGASLVGSEILRACIALLLSACASGRAGGRTPVPDATKTGEPCLSRDATQWRSDASKLYRAIWRDANGHACESRVLAERERLASGAIPDIKSIGAESMDGVPTTARHTSCEEVTELYKAGCGPEHTPDCGALACTEFVTAYHQLGCGGAHGAEEWRREFAARATASLRPGAAWPELNKQGREAAGCVNEQATSDAEWQALLGYFQAVARAPSAASAASLEPPGPSRHAGQREQALWPRQCTCQLGDLRCAADSLLQRLGCEPPFLPGVTECDCEPQDLMCNMQCTNAD
jgi:hypothetical protein